MLATMLYLAGPMDDVTTGQAQGWREWVGENAPSGVVCFSPAHAYLGATRANFPYVDQASRHMIKHCCHGMIANLSGPGRAFGTIREIEFARSCSTPVVVIGDLESLLTYDLRVVTSLESAMDAILEQIQEARLLTQHHPLAFLFGQPPSEEQQ